MAFVADDEATELVEPGEGSFHDPSVLAEMCAAFDTAPSDTRDDVAAAQLTSAEGMVIGLVSMELVGTSAWRSAPAADGLYGIEGRRQDLAIVTIGAGQDNGERNPAPVDRDMTLRARPATIGGVRPDCVAPFLAATDEESIEARDQSIAPASARRSSMCRWISSQSLAFCQARSLRQQVMPEHPATACGRRSHGIAVCSTNRMPIRASRLPTLGRPPFGRGGSDGKSGAISAHSASGRSSLAIYRQSAEHG